MKDPLDNQTIDFATSEMHIPCGQVLIDRQHHIAIVAKKTPKYAQLVHVQSSFLSVSKISSNQLVTEWRDANYPFENAIVRLLEYGNRHGITESAQKAIESLMAERKRPVQYSLFPS